MLSYVFHSQHASLTFFSLIIYYIFEQYHFFWLRLAIHLQTTSSRIDSQCCKLPEVFDSDIDIDIAIAIDLLILHFAIARLLHVDFPAVDLKVSC